MVILIGGSSHVGKTMVARYLVGRHGWECISLDFLKNAFQKARIDGCENMDDVQMRHRMWPFVAEIIKQAKAAGSRSRSGSTGCLMSSLMCPSAGARL